MRPVRLADRIAPYLGDTPPPSQLLARPSATSAPFVVVRRLFGPALGDAVSLARPRRSAAPRRCVGGWPGSARRPRSRSSASSRSCGAPRGTCSARLLVRLAGLARGARRPGAGRASPRSAALVGGVLGRDWWLTRQLERREQAMLAEFPVVADLLALAVVAGEAPADALPGSAG